MCRSLLLTPRQPQEGVHRAPGGAVRGVQPLADAPLDGREVGHLEADGGEQAISHAKACAWAAPKASRMTPESSPKAPA